MKQGKPVITFVMAAIAVTLCIYFGFHVFNTFNDPYVTTLAYQYVASDSIQAEGVLIRQEQVITGSDGIVEVTRGEGEKVGVGQAVALIHRDSKAQENQTELEALEREIALLEEAILDNGGADSATGLDESILKSVVALRSSAALSSYNDLEKQVRDVKAGILKRGYAYGDQATADILSARLKELKGQRSQLSAVASGATRMVTASKSGTFSTQVDGYESGLTAQAALKFTPAGLKQAMSSVAVPTDAIGKIITSNRWYFAANLKQADAQRLKKDSTVTVRFAGDFGMDVDMKVEHLSGAENDLVTVVLSSNRYLAQTTMLRRQTAELVFHSWSGLRVPKEAVHMEKYTYTDEETLEEKEGTRLGVYALMGGRAEWKGGSDHRWQRLLRGQAHHLGQQGPACRGRDHYQDHRTV